MFPKSYLLNWETEDTGKGGGRVKHGEGVDLVSYEVNLEILAFIIADLKALDTPCVSYRLPSDH